MADYNRNQSGSYRNSNQEWNENNDNNRNEWDENRNSGQNRRYNSNRNSGQGMGTDSYLSRHERERDDNGRYSDYGSGDMYTSGRYGRHFESDFNSGNYGSDRNYGYASYYGAGNVYGSGNTGSGNYGSGNYGSGNSGNSRRNLYDRDYEGMNRSSYSNSGTNFGGANYGSYGDRDRGYFEGRNEGRNYGGYGSGNRGNYGGSGYDRDRDSSDRNWWDRATDEVSSWFGDEDAERRRRRDRENSHRGKGPKNYSRSDERIKEDINDRLSDDPFIDASEIEVTVTNGEVTLTGSVDHRSTKRRAEDLAEAVSGVKNVENRIRVTSSAMTSPVSTGTTGSTSTMGSRSSELGDSSSSSSERSKNKRDYVTG